MYGAHHQIGDVDRMYLEQDEGGRGLIEVEDCVSIGIDSLERYLQKFREELPAAVNRNGAINRCGEK